MRITGRLLSTAAVATAMTIGLIGAGLAQDATPTAGQELGGAAYPNHFHLGTCDDFDPQPAIPLADLQFPEWVSTLSGEGGEAMGGAIPDPEAFGNAPIPAAVATTEVPMAIGDLVSGKYVVNVHNPDDPSQYVACGNVGGVPDARGDLFFGLEEYEGSGYSGVVWLHDNGGSTTVVVFLTHPMAQADIESGLAAMVATAAAEQEAAATPAAMPAASPEPTMEDAAEATPVVT